MVGHRLLKKPMLVVEAKVVVKPVVVAETATVVQPFNIDKNIK